MSERDDPEWRERVDSVVLYDKLEDLRVQLKELDKVVRGGRDSLLSEYRRHDQELTRLNAVIFQDPTGQKGLLHDVDVLMGRRKDRDETRGLKWQAWTAIIVAILGIVSVILRESFPKKDLLEQTIQTARHPKGKKIYRIHHLRENPPLEDGTESENQDKRDDLK